MNSSKTKQNKFTCQSSLVMELTSRIELSWTKKIYHLRWDIVRDGHVEAQFKYTNECMPHKITVFFFHWKLFMWVHRMWNMCNMWCSIQLYCCRYSTCLKHLIGSLNWCVQLLYSCSFAWKNQYCVNGINGNVPDIPTKNSENRNWLLIT